MVVGHGNGLDGGGSECHEAEHETESGEDGRRHGVFGWRRLGRSLELRA